MTFVDENNINRLFTPGKSGFMRSLSALDHDVMTCHPPRAIKAVENIINSFRNGEKDMFEFKINKGDKILRVRYLAVRDDDGTYMGTLECVDDPGQG